MKQNIKCRALIARRLFARSIISIFLFCSCAPAASAQANQSRRLAGVVRDQLNAPVAQAQISLYSASTLIAQSQTDDDGRFAFAALTESEGTLIVRANGFAQSEQKWRVAQNEANEAIEANEANEASELTIILAPAPLSEQVTISATRTTTRLGETAASVVILSTKDINATASLTLDDALRQVPGFQLFRRSGSRTANPTSQGVSLRGTGASGASRAVVLMDGVPLNDPFGGWITWGRVPRAAIERVEVLRGGASSLYGSNALGGVINIITQEPDAPTLTLEVSDGNQRTPNATLFAGAGKGKWRASLAGELLKTDGYIPVAKDERGRVDTLAGSRRAALDFKIERAFSQTLKVFVRVASFGEARTNGTPLQINRTHIRQWSAGGDWLSTTLGNLTARAYGGTQVYDQNFSAIAADRNSETLTRLQRVPAQVTGLSLQWSRAFGTRQTFVAGLEGREVRGASDEIVYTQGRPTSLVGAGGRERTYGLFVEDILRLTARLTLTGGVRVDRWMNYRALNATRALRPNAPTTATPFPDRNETAFSPQLSALYRVNEQISLNASAYRAFRQPTLNELYRAFRVGDVLTLANESLRAERLTGGEAGISVAPRNGQLNLRGTFFWTEINRPVANVTLNVAPTLITRQRQNLGRTLSRGIEIEIEERLSPRWTLSGGYLFADAKVAEFPANTALEGLRLPQVARHQLTFQMRYDNPALFDFSLQARASGEQFDDDQNRFPLDSYLTLDAQISRRLSRRFELFVAAENLLDQSYAIGRTPVTTLAPPLFARAGFRLRLGSQ